MEYLKEAYKSSNQQQSTAKEKNVPSASQDDDIFEGTPGVSSPKIKYGKYTGNSTYSRKSSALEASDIKDEDSTHFFGINKKLYRKSDSHVPPKTGTELVLLPRNPHFIREIDPFEPVYIPKQTILEDALKREAEKICFKDSQINKVVYDCDDASVYTKNLDSKDYDMDVLPFYIPTSKDDTTLVFESRFESGNLRRAIQIYEYEYDLILNPDYLTRTHTQWYYFSLANIRKDKEYRFNIINMMKPDSLYNFGMKPLFYSEAMAKQQKLGWHRDGYDICYYQNNMKKRNSGYYYTLTFTVKFKYDFDTVYLAHCYPYTYTDLCRYIKTIEEDSFRKSKVRRKNLCQTIAGNNCDFLTITNFNNDPETNKEKKAIIITSRVHPGETQASFVMEYIIDFLTGTSLDAKILRDNFVFKIVPMLNPDGVVNGNYRCNLAGVDLNRQWIDPSKKLHPSIFNTKLLMKKMKEEREIFLFCDIHGHSRKKNAFMYGCSGKDNKKRELVFPLLMRNNCDFFSFKDCSFVIQKDREATARVQLWKEFSISNCFTLEISFCGPDFGKYEYFHFTYDMFKELADTFCASILDISDPDQTKAKQVSDEIDQNIIKGSGMDRKEDARTGANNDGGDSDSSNDGNEGIKEEVLNVGGAHENVGFSLVSNQLGSQNLVANGQALGQRGPLAVINEIDDRKNKKKKPIVLTSNKKKAK